MLSKKSNLSIQSKAFVAKSSNTIETPKNDRLSFERFQSSPQSSSATKFNNFESVLGIRNKSNSNKHDELRRNSSLKSISTVASIKNQNEVECGSDSSEISVTDNGCYNSCFLGQESNAHTFSPGQYNKCYQKCPVGTATPGKTLSNSIQGVPMQIEAEASTQASSTSSDATEKKRRRRAGRKHRAVNKNNSDETTKSDKEKTKYKTEMCKNWVETGKCSYSVRCRFAHGAHELAKPKVEVEKEEYKSKPCAAFHQKHYCSYGVRCLFIHEERKVTDFGGSFFGKSLLINFETRNQLSRKRLVVFQSLTDCCA